MREKNIQMYLRIIESSCCNVFPYAYILSDNRQEAIELLVRSYIIAWDQINEFDGILSICDFIKSVLIRIVISDKGMHINRDESIECYYSKWIKGPDEKDDITIRKMIKDAVYDITLTDKELSFVKSNVSNMIS